MAAPGVYWIWRLLTISRKLLTTLALVVAAVSIGTTWVLVRRHGSDAPPGPPLPDVYAGIAAALTRPGMIALVRFETDPSNPSAISGNREAWLDAPNDLARVHVTMARSYYRVNPATAESVPASMCSAATTSSPSSPMPAFAETCAQPTSPSSSPTATPTAIPNLIPPALVSETTHQRQIYMRGASLSVYEGTSSKVPVDACTGTAKRIMTLFNNCPNPRSKIETHTESGRRFDGSDVLAIVTSGEVYGIDSTVEVHTALFIDPSTYLPVAYAANGVDRYALGNDEQTFHTTTRYAIDFVPRDSLPAGFFEPSSVGYLEPGPVEALDAVNAAFPLFWLGPEYAGNAVAPALALSEVRTVDPAQPRLSPDIQLTYARLEDQFEPLLTLSEVSAGYAHFDTSLSEWRRDACAVRTEVQVPGAHAVVYNWHIGAATTVATQCSEREADGFALELEFGATFVTVLLSPSPAGAALPNPYASEAALIAIAAAVDRRP